VRQAAPIGAEAWCGDAHRTTGAEGNA
jgi:hypothetical protein